LCGGCFAVWRGGGEGVETYRKRVGYCLINLTWVWGHWYYGSIVAELYLVASTLESRYVVCIYPRWIEISRVYILLR
jgi:uncharacterized membrane protein